MRPVSSKAAVPVPATLRASPPSGVAVTVNALPAGADAGSSTSSKVRVSAAPFTDASASVGAAVSGAAFDAAWPENAATAWPETPRSGLACGTA